MGEKAPRIDTAKGLEVAPHTAGYGGEVYNVDTLISLANELPSEVISIEILDGNIRGHFWHDKNGEWVGPERILALSEKYSGNPDWDALAGEYPELEDILQKIRKADLRHPILVVGENEVIDGMHRLTKAWAQGHTEIVIKRFDTLPQEALVKS